jgi:hypothetical protein
MPYSATLFALSMCKFQLRVGFGSYSVFLLSPLASATGDATYQNFGV